MTSSSDCLRSGFVPGLLLDGRFQTLSPLNHGSFGMVFLAKDIRNGDFVAIKCVSKTTSAAATAPDHLLELGCHNLLGYHPNVVNMIHAFEDEAHMFLVLEFCPMGDLYEAIRMGRGPLETEHVRSFMLQLVDAVEFMHAKGLYHRDIKPENILIAQDGSMKLGDFGLSTTETMSNEASVGSDRYMAPEQYDPADAGYSPAQADIWAIGICLLNVLFARNPFVTPSEDDVLFRDFASDKQSLFDIFPAMSQDTFDVLEHSMCMDPSKRSLTEMRKALGRVLSFTTDDDIFDEFCVEDCDVVPATANRQPLRTPSIQSPPVEPSGAFSWSRALHLPGGKSSRQLSAIPDGDLEEEDIFGAHSASKFDSLLESALGESAKSMKLQAPQARNVLSSSLHDSSRHNSATPKAVSGSLPITSSKPLRALASIFGKKNQGLSKSWSDLLDEDEDDDFDLEPELPALDKDQPFEPAHNWSTDSLGIELEPQDEDATPKPPAARSLLTSETKSVPIPGASPRPRSRTPARRRKQEVAFTADSSSEDVSSFEEAPPAPIYKLPLTNDVYSPPGKRSPLDKWAALGNKRRAYKSQGDLRKAAQESAQTPLKQGRTKSTAARTPLGEQRRTRERKNTGGSWRRSEDAKENKENVFVGAGAHRDPQPSTVAHTNSTSFNKNNNNNTSSSSSNNKSFFSFGKMGSAFGFGATGFGSRKDHSNFNVSKTKEIPRHDMVRIVDWRRGVPLRSRGGSIDNHVDVDEVDAEWVGGWHDLHV